MGRAISFAEVADEQVGRTNDELSFAHARAAVQPVEYAIHCGVRDGLEGAERCREEREVILLRCRGEIGGERRQQRMVEVSARYYKDQYDSIAAVRLRSPVQVVHGGDERKRPRCLCRQHLGDPQLREQRDSERAQDTVTSDSDCAIRWIRQVTEKKRQTKEGTS